MLRMASNRTLFIQYLFKFLDQKDYLWLKAILGHPKHTCVTSDIDLFIKKENIQEVLLYIQSREHVVKLERLDKGHAIYLHLTFADHSRLKIDLLTQLARKQWVYLMEGYLFKNRIWKNGIATYTSDVLLEHALLFNYLNYSGLPPKYVFYFEKMPFLERSRLVGFVNQKYGTGFTSIRQMASFDVRERKRIVGYLKTMDANLWTGRITHGVDYLLQVTKNIVQTTETQSNTDIDLFKLNDKTPLWFSVSQWFNYFRQQKIRIKTKVITFSGVDGAGKTTLLHDLKKVLSEQRHQNVVILRHRPSLLPILSAWTHGKKVAEAKAATTLPRQGKNKNELSSLLRFSYYFTDYLLGQFYVFIRYTLLGYTVIYDRYYFDFIIDGKRSNITLGERLPKWLYRFIFKPNLNIFLYAEPSVIRQRKQELPLADIESMTGRYKNLFHELSKRYDGEYLCIENTDRATSLNTILQHC